MKRTIFIIFIALLSILMLAFVGCSEDNETYYTPTPSISITYPANGDTIISTLNIRAQCNLNPDYVAFVFDTFDTVIDGTLPYSTSFDISLYPSGNESITAMAYWGDSVRTDRVLFYIEHIECDSTQPVILHGDTIPEDRIVRNANGCVISINMTDMMISDPNCLYGIEEYSSTLEALSLRINYLPYIDLYPLSECSNLKRLDISYNYLTDIDMPSHPEWDNLEELYLNDNLLTSIDLTSIWNLNSLLYLYINGNDLNSTSCTQVCDFRDEHPNCNVESDCDCGSKSVRNSLKSEREIYRGMND